jgi:hypothetical protein
MLARRTTAKIPACHQNRSPSILRGIQNETWVRLPIGLKTPVVEEKFAVSGALNTLEKLFGNDLVSIYVLSLERNDQAGMGVEGLHLEFSPPDF